MNNCVIFFLVQKCWLFDHFVFYYKIYIAIHLDNLVQAFSGYLVEN